MPAMELVFPHIAAAAQAAYEAYGDHANWSAYNGTPIPAWDQVRPDIREHWYAAVTGVVEALNKSAEVDGAHRQLAAEIAAASLFTDAKCLIWSNAHGGWWHASRHGYTTDVTHAARFTLEEAQNIVLRAGLDALNPQVKAVPEIAVLAPEERWDTPPQIPDGTVRLDLVHQVTGGTACRYLPFSLGPHETLQRLTLQVYGSDVFVQGMVTHEGGALHTICHRLDDEEPNRVDQVAM